MLKRAVIIVLCVLQCVEVMGFKSKMFNTYKTNSGEVFSLSARKGTYGYSLIIGTSYSSIYSSNEHAFFDVIIESQYISKFKSDLRALKAKCQEWGKIAQENHLSDYSKKLPLTLAYNSMCCFDIAKPNDTDIVCCFKYSKGTPSCEIQFNQRITQGGYISRACYTWIILDLNEISELINVIDGIIEEKRKRDINASSIDNLFK